ncbi:D-hexose-6-phosphate mutarotase [Oceanobacter mangrovi]|uniref:D-hexose-6-phosphate mutarotase n=1 Tax=Oceanobacter mangrovi TaxID=2862510 RepID=UPI001C8D44DE|nr:D-hexose-6-phosphate mutarotase [Oceanobacter mangrovi]
MQSQQIKTLSSRLSISAFCRLRQVDELLCIDIRHPAFSARVLPQGAQLVSFIPEADQDWLWLSPTAEYKKGNSLRGGVPICWPWFGNADRNPADVQALMAHDQPLPAHGFARTANWMLEELQEAVDQVELTFVLERVNHRQSVWHGQAEPRVHFILRGDSLQIRLTTTNTGSTALAFTQALHTYLPTASIHNSHIEGLSGAGYIDTLVGWQRMSQSGTVRFDGETDRIYLNSNNRLMLVTPDSRRSLVAEGSESTVVWNPGVEKARRLSQFPDHSWHHMLCIETANAADDWVHLAPGQSHTLAVSLARG